MNQRKPSNAQRSVQVAILPVILGCYCSTLDLEQYVVMSDCFFLYNDTITLPQEVSTA